MKTLTQITGTLMLSVAALADNAYAGCLGNLCNKKPQQPTIIVMPMPCYQAPCAAPNSGLAPAYPLPHRQPFGGFGNMGGLEGKFKLKIHGKISQPRPAPIIVPLQPMQYPVPAPCIEPCPLPCPPPCEMVSPNIGYQPRPRVSVGVGIGSYIPNRQIGPGYQASPGFTNPAPIPQMQPAPQLAPPAPPVPESF